MRPPTSGRALSLCPKRQSRREHKPWCSLFSNVRSRLRRATASSCAIPAGKGRSAAGDFFDLRAPARKRRRPERLAQLEAHAKADPQEALAGLLDQPAGLADLSVFARDRALSDGEVDSVVARTGAIRVVHAGAVAVLAPAKWLQLTAAVRAALEKFHAEKPAFPGVGIERLRLQLEPRLPRTAFAAMLQRLVRSEEISLRGGLGPPRKSQSGDSESDKQLVAANCSADRRRGAISAATCPRYCGRSHSSRAGCQTCYAA